jgi:hypothetical protein
MNNEFIPYEEALALKELGFDEPCLRYYVPREEYSDKSITYVLDWDGINYTNDCKAPLYQQAFRWFRENPINRKYPLHHFVEIYGDKYRGSIYSHVGMDKIEELFDTYEEAELACLRRIIEVVNYINN